MKDYSSTLNLPHTNFPMRADLTKKEPQILKRWEEDRLYKTIRKSRKNHTIFFLHDGPPYANGNIHIGHAVNKILKDIILKFKTLSDFDTPYIPGWDCHGLPIEQKIEHNHKLYKTNTRNYRKIRNFISLCRKYANQQVENQKKDFYRLGIFADWDKSYLTMDYKHQAIIIRTLGKIAQKGYLYLADKPVYWCFKCLSSLAEAEIEFKITSTKAIYVLIDIKSPSHLFPYFKNYKIKLVIWTTTPWTLPANQAVAVNPKYLYNLIKIYNRDECLLIEKTLTPQILKLMHIKKWQIIGVLQGNILENIKYNHPFKSNKVSNIILSDHVNNNQGTGLVHIATDYGLEDFLIGKKYNLPNLNIINNFGYYIKDKVPKILQGVHILEAELRIIYWLKLHQNLMIIQQIEHSYPYCWRHHSPVIYRRTPQWFINMEHQNLRTRCLKNINAVNWIPKKTKERISAMLNQRPDWCISRQRMWGVPIPLIIDKKTNLIHPDILKITKKISRLVENKGIKVWWKIKLKDILNNKQQPVNAFKKSNDILDVWFDSGCSFLFFSLSNHNYYKWDIIDLYLEGNDQHRGWFLSSLIISTILRNKPPYKSVITHGFVVDEKGKKMAKSEDNFVLPKEVIDKYGVDILRLWVASTNYIKEMNISYKKIKSIVDGYRRIRNTARYLLANLFDFNPLRDIVKYTKLLSIDKWALSQGFIIQNSILSSYEEYHFHEVSQKIINFCSVTMGSVYLEIIKDRQYTTPPKSLARKSCQTSMFYLLEALVKWIAPILPFTAFEIWQHIPNNNGQLIFSEVWSKNLHSLSKKEIINEDIWAKLFTIKDNLTKLIENLKVKKTISNTLELGILLKINNINMRKCFKIFETELNYFFLVSKVYVDNSLDIPIYWEKLTDKNLNKEVEIALFKINISKCARCWQYVNTYNYRICKRCINNIKSKEGENRKFF